MKIDISQMMEDAEIIRQRSELLNKEMESILNDGTSLADIKVMAISNHDKLGLAMDWLERMIGMTAHDFIKAKKYHSGLLRTCWETFDGIDKEYLNNGTYEESVLTAYFAWKKLKLTLR